MIGTEATREQVAQEFARELELAGPKPADPRADGSVGVTMFDLPGSSDLSVTVLLGRDQLQAAPSQSLLRIKSTDDKNYLGVVSAGPFAEPDGLRADSDILKAVATHRGDYLPPFHGRVQVTILGHVDGVGAVCVKLGYRSITMIAARATKPMKHSSVLS